MTTKRGRIATAIGKSSPSVKRVYTSSRPRNENRAMTKAASDAAGRTKSVVRIAISVLFASCRQKDLDWRMLS